MSCTPCQLNPALPCRGCKHTLCCKVSLGVCWLSTGVSISAASALQYQHCVQLLGPACNITDAIKLMLLADRTPTAVTIMGLLQTFTSPGAPIYFDHLAFRTFAVSAYNDIIAGNADTPSMQGVVSAMTCEPKAQSIILAQCRSSFQ